MKNIFCSSAIPIWTVRQPVCIGRDQNWNVISVIQSYSFWISFGTRKVSFSTFCLHAVCECRVFTLLDFPSALFSYFSSQLSSNESSLHLTTRFAVNISTETIWQPWFSVCSSEAMCPFLIWYSFIVSSVRFRRKVCFLHLFLWCLSLQSTYFRLIYHPLFFNFLQITHQCASYCPRLVMWPRVTTRCNKQAKRD